MAKKKRRNPNRNFPRPEQLRSVIPLGPDEIEVDGEIIHRFAFIADAAVKILAKNFPGEEMLRAGEAIDQAQALWAVLATRFGGGGGRVEDDENPDDALGLGGPPPTNQARA